MTTEPHTLSLKSQRVDKARREMLYRATCSCGWKLSYSITATGARKEHAEHVQQFLGPDAQAERLEPSLCAQRMQGWVRDVCNLPARDPIHSRLGRVFAYHPFVAQAEREDGR